MRIEDRIVAFLADVITETQATRTVLEAQLATTQAGARLRGHRPVPVGTGGVRLAWAGPGRLTGWTLNNPATDPATVTFRDSRDTTGDPIAIIAVPPGTSKELATTGVSFGEGLFVDITGRITGVVWLGPEQ